MSFAPQMIHTNPSKPAIDPAAWADCIRACFDCEQACVACADACLGEQDLAMLVRCIRLDPDCADVCDATGRIVSRQTAFDPQIVRAQVQACATACGVCAEHDSQSTCAECTRPHICTGILQSSFLP